MANWTHKEIEDLLGHITVIENYEDGELSFRELQAHDGYAIYDTTEEPYTDPETGETFPPLYSYRVGLSLSVNSTIYKAIPIQPGMHVESVYLRTLK